MLAAAAFLAGALIGGAGGDSAPRAEPDTARAATAALAPGPLAGQRLIAGWDGARPPRGLRRLIRDGSVAGVIVFADNLAAGAGATRTLIAGLQAIERPPGLRAPLLVMVDQEGGQVRRIDNPPTASAELIGARGQQYARRQGERTADGLQARRINVDLAPVLDIARPGGAIDHEQRSFGLTAEQVTEVGVDGFAAGLRDGGIAATAKHFPGLGAAAVNTDRAAQRVPLALDDLRSIDEAPFAAFSAAGGELVMLSLATYPALADRPAAFSTKVVEGELRGRLGFGGVTITDGLGAAAAGAFGDPARVALAAEAAGNDLLLYSDWRTARDIHGLFERRLRSGELERGRFEAAAGRVLALRGRIGSGSQ